MHATLLTRKQENPPGDIYTREKSLSPEYIQKIHKKSIPVLKIFQYNVVQYKKLYKTFIGS